MVTILLLTCGTNACFHFAKVLKERFADHFRIIGADVNKPWLVATSQFLDAFYQCPYNTSGEYYDFIIDVCRKEKAKFILPTFDADQQLFFDGNRDLKALGIKSLGVSESFKNIYGNKSAINDYLRSIGLPTPECYDIHRINGNNHYFIKPTEGNNPNIYRIIKGKDLLHTKTQNLLIQEVCTPPEVTLECFHYNGELRTIARERIETKAGVCTKTKVYFDKQLHAIAKLFAEKTPLPYIFNLQFMQDSKGNAVITDVNLKLAGGMSLSYTAGWDEASALAKVLLHLPLEEILQTVSVPVQEQYIVRTYNDVVTKKIKHHVAFDLDGTLLNSTKRHEVLMDKILRCKGYNISTDDLVAFKSEGGNNVTWLRSKGVNDDVASEINKLWIDEIESRDCLMLDELYPKAKDALVELAKENELYLITARNNPETLNLQLKHFGIMQYFADVIVVKSNSHTADNKAKKLNAHHIDIFVGDTESDLKASQKAGCRFIAATYGFRSKRFWNQFETTDINDIKELNTTI